MILSSMILSKASTSPRRSRAARRRIAISFQSSALGGHHFPTFYLILATFLPHLSITFASFTMMILVSAKLPVNFKL